MLQLRYNSESSATLSSTDLRESIEKLFLLRRFEEALQLSYVALLDICEDPDTKKKGKERLRLCRVEVGNIAAELLNLHHRCNRPEDCECVAIISLVVQILYEVGKAQEVILCVTNFYGDLLKTPYDVLFLW